MRYKKCNGEKIIYDIIYIYIYIYIVYFKKYNKYFEYNIIDI
jgi:hypothetical protein